MTLKIVFRDPRATLAGLYRAGHSVAIIANQLGVSRQYLYAAFSGKYGLSPRVAMAYAKFMGQEFDDLFIRVEVAK